MIEIQKFAQSGEGMIAKYHNTYQIIPSEDRIAFVFEIFIPSTGVLHPDSFLV